MQRPSLSSRGERNPIVEALKARHGVDSWISMETFVEAALYLPEHGYYRRAGERVGPRDDRDFYTASSLGSVFSRLVIAAVQELLPASANDYTFVELGAEPSRHLLSEVDHPFASQHTLRVGQTIDLEGPCVVFSNELFDAQPFRQFRFTNGCWEEMGVRLRHDEPALEPIAHPASFPADLPRHAPDGYCLDYPSGAARLAESIVGAPWHGLFLAFDYGLSWPVLSEDRPHGTARTYQRHRQGTDLLTSPGERDLTHHICWDHLSSILEHHGFSGPVLETQEAFFMRHAVPEIARMIEKGTEGLSRDRQTLKELLHPENMGRKFQVLHAQRSANSKFFQSTLIAPTGRFR